MQWNASLKLQKISFIFLCFVILFVTLFLKNFISTLSTSIVSIMLNKKPLILLNDNFIFQIAPYWIVIICIRLEHLEEMAFPSFVSVDTYQIWSFVINGNVKENHTSIGHMRVKHFFGQKYNIYLFIVHLPFPFWQCLLIYKLMLSSGTE